MSENIINPYANRKGNWVKGNLHTHSIASACGRVELKEILDLYNDLGYGFIALTDHDIVTEVSQTYKDLIIIKGYEASQYSHILCIALKK